MKKKENRNNYIYIVLVKALTGLGKFARLTGKYEYTHIAVCLDEKLDKFYTFSRKKHHAPFDCGFMIETLDCYAFDKHKNIKLKIFKIPVQIENYNEIKKYINKIQNDKEYTFNIFSMITMPIFHGVKIYKSHNCMSFVGKIIQLSKTIKMTKPYYKYNIKEFDKLLVDYLYKEEYFNKEKIETKNYMTRVGILNNLINCIKLNSRIFYRLIFKRENKNE